MKTCKTPGAIYKISIGRAHISILVDLPEDLRLSKKQAKELELLLHGSTEEVLHNTFEFNSRGRIQDIRGNFHWYLPCRIKDD